MQYNLLLLGVQPNWPVKHELQEKILCMFFLFHKGANFILLNLLPTKTVLSNKVFASFIGRSITCLKISEAKHKSGGNARDISIGRSGSGFPYNHSW